MLEYWVKVYDLEISACFVFQGHVKGDGWIKKKIDEIEKKVQTPFEKCMKNAA